MLWLKLKRLMSCINVNEADMNGYEEKYHTLYTFPPQLGRSFQNRRVFIFGQGLMLYQERFSSKGW